MGIIKEQARKKSDFLPDGESETTRALQTEVRKLAEKLSKVSDKSKGNVNSVASPGVRAVQGVQQGPGDVTSVGSWGILVEARCVKERVQREE